MSPFDACYLVLCAMMLIIGIRFYHDKQYVLVIGLSAMMIQASVIYFLREHLNLALIVLAWILMIQCAGFSAYLATDRRPPYSRSHIISWGASLAGLSGLLAATATRIYDPSLSKLTSDLSFLTLTVGLMGVASLFALSHFGRKAGITQLR